MKHHPWLFRAARLGAWAHCPCGWRSRWSYTTVTGAHVAFGGHLLLVATQRDDANQEDEPEPVTTQYR